MLKLFLKRNINVTKLHFNISLHLTYRAWTKYIQSRPCSFEVISMCFKAWMEKGMKGIKYCSSMNRAAFFINKEHFIQAILNHYFLLPIYAAHHFLVLVISHYSNLSFYNHFVLEIKNNAVCMYPVILNSLSFLPGKSRVKNNWTMRIFR